MTIYDEQVRMYLEFIDRVLDMENNPFARMLGMFEAFLGPEPGRVLDVCCGEGYMSRAFASRADEVVGVDISSELIAVAGERTDATNVSFVVEDAQTLGSLEDASFDAAVSQMAAMDVPDHRAFFAAVRRVLKPDAPFAFSLLHPCFEGPYDTGQERFLKDENDVWIANVVHFYAREGHWQSPSEGVRGAVGSHHRMLSTYMNDLIAADFRLERIEEPVADDAPGIASQIPRVMAIFARAV